MDVQLRTECKNLLDQLKSSQKLLANKVLSTSSSTLKEDNRNNEVMVSDNLNTVYSKPTYARSKLGGLSKTSSIVDEDVDKEVTSYRPNMCDLSRYRLSSVSKHLPECEESGKMSQKDVERKLDSDTSESSRIKPLIPDQTQEAPTSSWYPATPNTLRKRQLIDRHTNVPSNLNADELKGLDNERLLNFSYCHVNVDDDVTKLKQCSRAKEDAENTGGVPSRKMLGETKQNSVQSSTSQRNPSSSLYPKNFKEQLQDDGNNRTFNNWLKETASKPKSLLNSTAYYSLNPNKKNSSRVRFDSSVDHEPQALDQHLLGYDWIAALLDNDPNLVNQSESFFDDIRDFRKAFKDECSNRFYMETPYTLVDTEPEPVVEALTEPKVRPYIVNDRLFTEPLKPGIIDYEDDNNGKVKCHGKEPTEKNPRFVRVSIPRSTLQTPYRVKPHRRGSFDGSDSCSLVDHCLLGWENTRPVMMPSAKTLDLNTEAGTRIDSETTTLAEAERLATEHNRVKWPFSKPSARLQTLPMWRKHYMNTTLNMSLPSASGNITGLSNEPDNGSLTGNNIKRATDRILSATYSTMYEMERLRQERELERKRDQGERK